jgi:hypothetical protein
MRALPSNGSFSGSTVLALSKYATLYLQVPYHSDYKTTTSLKTINQSVVLIERQDDFCEAGTEVLDI